MTDLAARALAYRRAYDEQLRGRRAPGGFPDEQVGPVLRASPPGARGLITYRNLGGLDGAALDAFIAAQVAHFARRGQEFEWKLHGHDRPSDLAERLRAAGLAPEDDETVMIGETAQLAAAPELPLGARLREVSERADLERIQRMEEHVWGEDHSWLPDALQQELAGDGDPCVVVVAEVDGEVACAGWVRFHEGADFASLWGGSTLPEHRGKGLYRATVAYRAGLAAARGFRYAQVDASADSRPILARLGLLPAATTTPFIWRPPGD